MISCAETEGVVKAFTPQSHTFTGLMPRGSERADLKAGHV